jgi:hypothetical protein
LVPHEHPCGRGAFDSASYGLADVVAADKEGVGAVRVILNGWAVGCVWVGGFMFGVGAEGADAVAIIAGTVAGLTFLSAQRQAEGK